MFKANWFLQRYAFLACIIASPTMALDLEERMEAQALISALGQPISIDGAIGPMTRNAVAQVFEERGRSFSGTVDERALADLRLIFYSSESYDAYPMTEISTADYRIATSYQHGGEDVSNELFEATDLNGDGFDDLVIFTRKFANRLLDVRLTPENIADWVVVPRVLLWSPGSESYQVDAGFSDSLGPTFWPRVVFFEDFDGDGWNDLLVADHGNDAQPTCGYPNQLFRNVGGSHFEKVEIPSHFDYTHAAEVGDFDQDGDVDILVLNAPYINGSIRSECLRIFGAYQNESYFLENQGEMRFEERPIARSRFPGGNPRTAHFALSNENEPTFFLGMGDDAQGRPDRAYAYNFKDFDLSVLYQLPQPNAWPDGLISHFQDFDLDGDGTKELAVAWSEQRGCCGWNGNLIQIIDDPFSGSARDITSDSHSTSMGADRYSQIGFCANLHAVDLNADGREDLLCTSAGSIYMPVIFINEGGKLAGYKFSPKVMNRARNAVPVIHGNTTRIALSERKQWPVKFQTTVVELSAER